jgi:hypothetical protein
MLEIHVHWRQDARITARGVRERTYLVLSTTSHVLLAPGSANGGASGSANGGVSGGASGKGGVSGGSSGSANGGPSGSANGDVSGGRASRGETASKPFPPPSREKGNARVGIRGFGPNPGRDQ